MLFWALPAKLHLARAFLMNPSLEFTLFGFTLLPFKPISKYIQDIQRYTKIYKISEASAGPPRPARPRRHRHFVFCISWHIFVYLRYVWIYVYIYIYIYVWYIFGMFLICFWWWWWYFCPGFCGMFGKGKPRANTHNVTLQTSIKSTDFNLRGLFS